MLRAFIRTARMIRHTPRLAAGLPPDDEVLLDVPDERLAPALVAAGRGDYGPAAKLLATSREAAEWENRDRYTTRLAAFARSRPEWFDDWLGASPHDPDALLLKAELAVMRGWESPARAELLRDAGPLLSAAAEADPRDPVPWRIALDHARGTHAPHTVFEQLWEEAVRRSSYHYGCHASALQYLSAAWYGSHRECFDFAERAAQDALPGSLIQVLPARAAFAYLTSPSGKLPRGRLDAAADLAIALSREYDEGDPWPAEVRNLLTYVLVRLERWEDALEQLRLIGPYATSFPWDRMADDPLGQFLELRDGVRIEVASMTPLRTPRDRARPGEH
ncbi:putative membrane protein [Streptomyces formicae]|uniref:Putative membrane protein n=2 Tax=Streptomyces formicae TaxID=1616117 RepID=A0A291Q617_9ACTN|nr:putative membrane protein [Streptomyces formicae]